MDSFTPQFPFSFTPAGSASTNLTAACLFSTLPSPSLFGGEILNVTSSLVSNYTAQYWQPPFFFNSDPPLYGEDSDLSFCNVTVTYTHPGQNDVINVFLWLPLSMSDGVLEGPGDTGPDPARHSNGGTTSPSWNGLLLSQGGGGFSMCLPDIISHSYLSQGYAISRTDGGHPPQTMSPEQPDTETWAMLSPGNVNLYLLQDFASVCLHDMAVISKSIVTSFYGVSPKYSYFQGCSTGGRQGLMLAQRYPRDYDGILAGAPGIYWPKLVVMHYFPYMMMHSLKAYPPACELDAITRAAIEGCDELDGVKDGIIANEEECEFDPFKLVGKEIPCEIEYADDDNDENEDEGDERRQQRGNHAIKIGYAAAHIAWHLWGAARGSIRQPDWHRLTHSTPLSSFASTICFRQNHSCVADPTPLLMDWIRLFLYKDPSLTSQDLAERITLPELVRLFDQSEEEYHSVISTSNPDLSAFHRRGGKIITWHGTADQAIPPGQTQEYYEAVLRHFSETPPTSSGADDRDRRAGHVRDFFRLFLVPGVQHCGYGEGALPVNVLTKLRDWVERGIAPDVLHGESFTRANRGDGDGDGSGDKITRPLCPYPLVARYKGHGDVRKAESFECATSF
ncbi:uncharacterized protein Z520_01940 [Fonsecaea multimorphosa CBS 102226]|uniref:Carboxylic ester hydrolase n=1 Tax=Fonsecaea multimorphosa CBS 102226 TaxID=1442371 RepID=A0A0D2IXN8_9EURO|nr:uncharacterized protein Z520_01940 [Fonsecaea multimorphosa CBS 102226]KIY01802.1 hypothetical protein Z520_01940 [Fonsecaea multimorphosa CBS 102226]OAL29993.1 hypothetical protein AYO22_01899 [Fonsecaea multimorphosa]